MTEAQFPLHLTSRREFLRGAGATAGALTAGSILAACGGSSSGNSAKVPASISWGLGNPLPTLNPIQGFNYATTVVVSLALEGLMTFDNNLRLAPALAQSVRQPSATEYVYTLRPNARFSDGKPVTASDVVFSLNQNLKPSLASQYAAFFGSVAHIAATGPREVTITLKHADPNFKYTVAQSGAYVIPERQWRSVGNNLGSPSAVPIGSGPYAIKSYVAGQTVTLAANPYYSGPRSAIKHVKISVITNTSDRLLALKSGEIDGTFDVPFTELPQWRSQVQILETPGLTPVFITFNMQKHPWSDPHVRRAIAYSIDKAALVKNVLHGAGIPATAFVPPPEWPALGISVSDITAFYKTLPQYPYDPGRAKAEMAASSVPSGFSWTLHVPTDYPEIVNTGLVLANSLAKLGIHLNVQQQPTTQYFARLFSGSRSALGMELLLYAPDYPDPSDDIKYFLTAPSTGSFNLSSWGNSEVDRLFAEQNATLDPGKRASALKSILSIVADELPLVPIWWENQLAAHRHGIPFSRFSSLYYYEQWTHGFG